MNETPSSDIAVHAALERAIKCARAMIDIGVSVSNEWQRRIDRIQPHGGVHIGMAMGNVDTLSQRAFSQSHIGAVGDVINLAARLTGVAGPSETVISNSVRQVLPENLRSRLQVMETLEAENVGRVKAWRFPDPYQRSR